LKHEWVLRMVESMLLDSYDVTLRVLCFKRKQAHTREGPTDTQI
jgi:hypothetical protein